MFLSAFGPCAHAGDDLIAARESFKFSGLKRTYYLIAPAPAPTDPAAPMPLLVVLHGSYGSARKAIEPWLALSRAEGFVTAAPEARDRTAWQIRDDSPAFLRAMVDAVAADHPINRRRIYLFGHSGGAVYALTLSMLESTFYAATAVHAGAWRSEREFIAVPHASRKIPVAIFLGDHDEYFPLFAARNTEEALKKAGHRVSLTIIPGHTHNYGKVAHEVNRAAFDFLKTAELEPALVTNSVVSEIKK